MDFVIFVSSLFSLLLKHVGAQPTPQTCSPAVYVGNAIDSTTIPVQSSHGAGQSVIVYDPFFTIPCTCGLLTGWQLIRYDNAVDGCKAYSCHATLMVYRNLNINTMNATLVGYYNATKIETLTPDSKRIITINLPPSNWIPVIYGDYIGWEGSPSPVTYFEEPTCPGTCTSGLGSSPMFFYGSNKSPLTSGSQIAFFNGPKNSYPNWRYFGFRAIVWSGTEPYFTNLPKTLTVDDSTAVGTVVWTVKASDDETGSQNLTLAVLWTCSLTSYFYMDPATGNVSLVRSLVGGPTVHGLGIEVSDGCLKADDQLTINVISTLNTTLPPTTTTTTVATTTPTKAPDVLGSPVGASLLAVTILASLVAIGSSIAMCVLGWQMSNITKELGEMPPMNKSQAPQNNQRSPWNGKENLPTNYYNQERGNVINRKSNPPGSNINRDSPAFKSLTRHDGSRTPSTTHGGNSSDDTRLTPVEQLPKAGHSPRASPGNYPPRDMLYW